MSVIKINHVTKDYGQGRGIFDVTFEVQAGEVFGFLGPNGAGKTTTIRHLMGFIQPQSGTLSILGNDCWQDASAIKREVGYLPGELAYPEYMTGVQFIEFMAEQRQLKNTSKIKALKELFEFDASGPIKSMSLGDKRKLAIVTAFMHDPQVLILDEPTSGLDPMMQQRFVEFVLAEKKLGKTILLSSHIFSEVEAMCERIAIIKDGVIVSTIHADDIEETINKSFKIEFLTSNDYQKFVKNTEFTEIIYRPLQNQVKLTLIDQELQNLFIELSAVKLKFISEIQLTLEDYFMDFYDRDKSVSQGKKGLNHDIHTN